MKQNDFFDSETTRRAYLGKHAFDLINLASQQAAIIYSDRGLLIPMEVSSTLQYLDRQGELSVADIAKALDLPHQLATQRVEKLIKLALILRKPDRKDGRRSLLRLTKKGRDQAKLLEASMFDISELYQELFDEIGCDLSKLIPAATAALQHNSLVERLAKKKTRSRKPSLSKPRKTGKR